MEAWGLLTVDWMGSGTWWRRAAGAVIGALAVALMSLLMAYAALTRKRPP